VCDPMFEPPLTITRGNPPTTSRPRRYAASQAAGLNCGSSPTGGTKPAGAPTPRPASGNGAPCWRRSVRRPARDESAGTPRPACVSMRWRNEATGVRKSAPLSGHPFRPQRASAAQDRRHRRTRTAAPHHCCCGRQRSYRGRTTTACLCVPWPHRHSHALASGTTVWLRVPSRPVDAFEIPHLPAVRRRDLMRSRHLSCADCPVRCTRSAVPILAAALRTDFQSRPEITTRWRR
jgi:hypothetical protein